MEPGDLSSTHTQRFDIRFSNGQYAIAIKSTDISTILDAVGRDDVQVLSTYPTDGELSDALDHLEDVATRLYPLKRLWIHVE